MPWRYPIKQRSTRTSQPWPVRFDTRGTARYLRIAHNLPVAEATLTRQRSRGQGIRWKYLGQKPIAERAEIDRYVREEALRDVSPLKAGAQARAARERRERRLITGEVTDARVE